MIQRNIKVRPSILARPQLVNSRRERNRDLHSSVILRNESKILKIDSFLQFPGAPKSEFTSNASFHDARDLPSMSTYRVLNVDGSILNQSSNALDGLSHSQIITMYKNMLTVKIMDEIMMNAQRQGRTSFYMVSAGEEAISVGSASALTHEDVLFLQYREQGALIQRGAKVRELMAQLFSNKDDEGHGRNMPVHYGSRVANVRPISSPLGTQIPQAAGAAYALKILDRMSDSPKRIVACYFGEGAASEGDFHAGLNIAATKSCPVVFVCRNNGFAISTASLEQYRGDGIASRGPGYGIPTLRVDGNDIFAVRHAMLLARELALVGECRPVLIEAMSYRVSHHSTSDDSFAYRAKRDVEEWKRRDNPISRLRKWMENSDIWSEAEEAEAVAVIRKDVLQDLSVAEKTPKPAIRKMWEDVYEHLTDEAKEQIRDTRRLVEKYPAEYDLSSHDEGVDGLKL